MLGHAPLASTPLADIQGQSGYTGTVAGLTFAATFGQASGTYAGPGVPAYTGTVTGLNFSSAWSVATGSFLAFGVGTTLVENLQALLDPLAAGGAWYGANTREPPVYPFIVWTRIVSVPNWSFDGASNNQNTRVQIDVFAQSLSEAVAIEQAIETAMAAWSVSNVGLSSQDGYEDAVRAYRVTKDYSVWATN